MSSYVLRAFRLSCQQRPLVSSVTLRYASAVASKAVKRAGAGIPRTIPKPQSAKVPLISPRPTHLNVEQTNKQYAAKKLYSQGVQAIYRAPSHFGVLSVSWLIGVTFVGTAVVLYSLGHWREDPNSGLTGLQAMTVTTGYRLGMMFFAGIGYIAILRYKGLITALDLVPRGDLVYLRVKVRKMSPFRKPTEFVVPTYDFRAPYKWILPMHDPAWVANQSNQPTRDLNPLRVISKFFYIPFRWFRTYIFRDGIMKVRFQNADQNALLDTNGWFSNDAKDFLEITTIDKPWSS